MFLIISISRSIDKNFNEIFINRFLKLRIVNSFEMNFDNFKSISFF